MHPGEAPPVELNGTERLYRAAATAAFGLLWIGARAAGVSADSLRCRRGTLPAANGPLLWFHGASVGELGAACALATLLAQRGYQFTAAYTASNQSGVEFVAHSGTANSVVALAPWDHPRWVARALEQWQPRALFLVETELWPTLIFEAWRRKVPVFCVSARIYPRDVARYRLIRSLVVPMLRRVTAVLAQNDTERARLVALGADPECCSVAGNLKYVLTEAAHMRDSSWRSELGLHGAEPVVVFGSVHGDEVPLIFAALEQLPMRVLRVIVAPRHAPAVAAVVRAARQRKWHVHRRTAGPPPRDWQILVLDRMGELSSAYAMASVAVVGGGFGKHGGHNPLEPVMVGAPVIFGEHFDHFAQEVQALQVVTPEARVTGAVLGRRLAEWLNRAAERQRIQELQRRCLPDGAAIAQRYLTILSPWLGGNA
ncbi:MAG TPA: glycosyltransferase N-terminal domain-containing protein [Candidatus Margulisiibacteriota bacterium]|nr:glycosyltransferase N-terminal domain-containing protein [Candidatus Margulisiibacteriota bacterium]